MNSINRHYAAIRGAFSWGVRGDRNYRQWIEEYESHYIHKLQEVVESKPELRVGPVISIVMPVYKPNLNYLKQAIESVRNQIYEDWELCIADDCSSCPETHEMLEHYTKVDRRIRYVTRESNGHISRASNSALELASGEFVALFDQDDLLAKHALLMASLVIKEKSNVGLIYSDEDKLNELGYRFSPYFKTDWNLHLFRSHNMISHLGIYRRKLMVRVGGFRPGLEGSQDYDLALRIAERLSREEIHHIPQILYHWRVHSGSTAAGLNAKPYVVAAAEKALSDHYTRCDVDADVVYAGKGVFRTIYALKRTSFPVGVVCKEKFNKEADALLFIRLLATKTEYPQFSVAVAVESAIRVYEAKVNGELTCRRLSAKLQFHSEAELINKSIDALTEDWICVIGAIRPRTSQWLAELVGVAGEPDIGCVGGKILNKESRILRAGFAVGGANVYAGVNYLEKGAGYRSRAISVQELSAVSSDCMLVNRKLFQELSGFDLAYRSPDLRDIDFCLRARKLGYKVVWTPHSELVDDEAAATYISKLMAWKACTLGEKDKNKFLLSWKSYRDPFFCEHASFQSRKFKLDVERSRQNDQTQSLTLKVMV